VVDKNSPISSEKFLDKRIVFMEGDFTEESCRQLSKELLYLSVNNEREDVTLFIDSFGGSAYELLRIYSILKVRPFKLKTVVVGKAMSAGAYLLLMGDERIAYPFSSIMLHELTASQNHKKLHDLEDDHKENVRLQKIICELVKKTTKIERVSEFLKRDRYMAPKEALRMGVISKIKER